MSRTFFGFLLGGPPSSSDPASFSVLPTSSSEVRLTSFCRKREQRETDELKSGKGGVLSSNGSGRRTRRGRRSS